MTPEHTAAEAFRHGGDRAELALLNHPRLTRPQQDFAANTERFLLWLGGNSIGKSYGHAWDLVQFARGTHPFRPVPGGERKVLVAGFSFAQMDPLVEKLWQMLPKGEIHPKLYYAPGQGIKGFKEPVVPFVAGPGRGSVIHFATYQQGADRIMGFQGHRLSLDEPPPASVYAEARPRLNRYRGELRITMTPTPESPPLEYLMEEVEQGKVTRIQTSYNQANVTVHGGLVPWPWKRQAEIEEDIASYLADERGMREHGDWVPVLSGRWLERVTDECYTDLPLPLGKWFVAVGIDHGARPGREWATLAAASADGHYAVLDEAHEDKVTSMDEDAANILAMLARNNLTPWDVDHWVGDRATSESFFGGAKSNHDLARAISRQLRMSYRDAAAKGLRIHTMFKERGSVRRGIALMNTLAAQRRFRINNRCAGFRAGQQQWTGDPASELKDALDSARYAIITLHDRADVRKVGTMGRIM